MAAVAQPNLSGLSKVHGASGRSEIDTRSTGPIKGYPTKAFHYENRDTVGYTFSSGNSAFPSSDQGDETELFSAPYDDIMDDDPTEEGYRVIAAQNPDGEPRSLPNIDIPNTTRSVDPDGNEVLVVLKEHAPQAFTRLVAYGESASKSS